MTKELAELLDYKIKQSVRLQAINDVRDKLASCYQQGEITESEYNNLLGIYKEHLKIVLDLNLLPDRQSINEYLENQSAPRVAKLDAAEMVAEELEFIEQEAIRLNCARLEYIQDKWPK